MIKKGPFYGLTPEQQTELHNLFIAREMMVAASLPVFYGITIVIPVIWFLWPFEWGWLVLVGILICNIASIPMQMPTGNSSSARKREREGAEFLYWVIFVIVVCSIIKSIP